MNAVVALALKGLIHGYRYVIAPLIGSFDPPSTS